MFELLWFRADSNHTVSKFPCFTPRSWTIICKYLLSWEKYQVDCLTYTYGRIDPQPHRSSETTGVKWKSKTASSASTHQLHFLLHLHCLCSATIYAWSKVDLLGVCDLCNKSWKIMLGVLHYAQESGDVRMLRPITIPYPTFSFEKLQGGHLIMVHMNACVLLAFRISSSASWLRSLYWFIRRASDLGWTFLIKT